MAVLRYGCCYGCHASQERIKMSVVLWLLESSSSLLACALPILGSANSVNSKTPGMGRWQKLGDVGQSVNLQLWRMNKSREPIYCMTVLNNTILNTVNLLRM